MQLLKYLEKQVKEHGGSVVPLMTEEEMRLVLFPSKGANLMGGVPSQPPKMIFVTFRARVDLLEKLRKMGCRVKVVSVEEDVDSIITWYSETQ